MKPYQNSVHSSGSHTRALAVGLAIVTVLWQGSASGHQMDGRVFVFCVEKDGSNLERVSGELTGSASGPTWAPDGKRILYELFDGKTSSAWSPDGRSICFVSNRRETVLEAFSQWIARPLRGAHEP